MNLYLNKCENVQTETVTRAFVRVNFPFRSHSFDSSIILLYNCIFVFAACEPSDIMYLALKRCTISIYIPFDFLIKEITFIWKEDKIVWKCTTVQWRRCSFKLLQFHFTIMIVLVGGVMIIYFAIQKKKKTTKFYFTFCSINFRAMWMLTTCSVPFKRAKSSLAIIFFHFLYYNRFSTHQRSTLIISYIFSLFLLPFIELNVTINH